MIEKIRIAFRRSDLAIVRSELFINAIKSKFPEIEIERLIKVPEADKYMKLLLSDFGKQGGFTGVFEKALQEKEIDIAVHCGKDVPLTLPEGIAFHAFSRGDDRNVIVFLKGVVTKNGDMLEKITGETVRFTVSNFCRKMQIDSLFKTDCVLERANVPEQIAWLRNGETDCIMVSASAVDLLYLKEMEDLDFLYLERNEIVPVFNQSVIGVEYRSEDKEIEKIIKEVADKNTVEEVQAERYLLSLLKGGVDEMIGVNCHIKGEEMSVCGAIYSDSTAKKAALSGEAITWSYMCDKVYEKLSGRR